MNWTIRKKMILAIVAMALLPFILGVIIIEGSLFERIERSVDENGMFPSYEKAEAQKKMFLTLVKEQIREDEEGLDGHKLNYFDSNSLSKLLGFYVEMDDMEIYRSEWLGNQDIEPIIVDDIENTYDYEGNLGLFDQAEILTLDHTYNIYTIYNYDNFVSIITKYIAYLVIVAVSLFALIAFLLIVWVFRHMRYSLGQIKKMTESILDGDLKTPVPYGRRDEFLELAGMIDTLRADLHQSNLDKAHLEVERERMLVNITHDIKTPITAIKGC